MKLDTCRAPSAPNTALTLRARRGLIEVVVLYALVQAALWTLGRAQLGWAAAAGLWVLGATLASPCKARDVGLGAEGFRESLWIVPLAMVIALLIVIGAWFGGILHVLSGARTPLWHAFLYGVWAFVQQFMVESFIFVRLEAALHSRGRAVVWTGILFCLAHIPNPVLMPATLIIGLGFTCIFAQFRNLYPLAIAHALLGLAIAVSIPDAVTHHMRVGIVYWQ